MIQTFSTDTVTLLLDEARQSLSARNFEAAARTLQAASEQIDQLAGTPAFQQQGDRHGHNS